MTIAAPSAEDSRQRIADTTHDLLLEADRTPDPRHQQLLDQVVILNAPVARSIASRYRSKGVDSDDLEQWKSAIRPNTLSGRPPGFVSSSVRRSGTQHPCRIGNPNPAGMTPTIVCATSSMSTLRPMTPGSA